MRDIIFEEFASSDNYGKISKRDIDTSNQRLINDDKRYRCISNDNEIQFPNYIKIDNSNLSAEAVAKMIKEHFEL